MVEDSLVAQAGADRLPDQPVITGICHFKCEDLVRQRADILTERLHCRPLGRDDRVVPADHPNAGGGDLL
jgi:hypothetical protein